ncbi:MAG: EAL domain-containing protein [Steroidobacteraceae bacterium]|jgi:diguanylate cyclase (GGDEF)-like protein|nr:EAL domain-containing protein [Steroidobacteraceae bacterium]
MAPTPAERPRRRRLGFAARLGLGFTAIAAVLLLGHAAAQRDMRAAIDTLGRAQTAQVPLARAAEALTYRVLAFDRAVLAEVRRPTEASRINVTEAEAAMFGSLDAYAELQPGASRDVARLREEARGHAGLAWSLIDVGEQRQAALNGIRESLDGLARRISTAFAADSTLPDPVHSRRVYAELELALGRLRSALNSYLVSGPEAPDTELRAATRHFRATLAEFRGELARSPGRAWLDLVEEDLGTAERLQQEVLGLDASLEALRARFSESGRQLPERLDAALAAPASRAVADAAGSAEDAARSAERAISRLTFQVLGVTLLVSLLTMLAVLRPVSRLTRATRAFARGGRNMRVPSGGPRELDELAQAFNQMAERLSAADQEVARQQQQLEDRVRARTRKLTFLAHHDPLTGLPNRRFAFNHLRRAARSAARRGAGLGLIALDIDNFKVINDSFGHATGDELLKAIAGRLRLIAGEGRFIARLGGDEFVVAMEESSTAQSSTAMAESIVNGFRAPLALGGREILVSVSVGVALMPEHAADAAGLVRAADTALFRAKALGRNRISTFSRTMLEGSEERFRLEQSLRRALDASELALEFQPQVSLPDGSAIIFEALLRWRRDGGPAIPAGDFIAIAEQSGLIIEVGEWVLDTAAAAVADWRARGLSDARVAINVSVHQLLDNRFVDRLSEVLERHRLPGEAIELELTETAFQTSPATVEALRRVRGNGIGLALDDFGTGYSSINSLSRLPLRRVKLDRSLVADAPGSRRTESIARSIIGVCHTLGLEVTVEGIERTEQLAWLCGFGTLQAQGFLIARPMPAADVPDFAHRSAAWVRELRASATVETGATRRDDAVVPFRPAPGTTRR